MNTSSLGRILQRAGSAMSGRGTARTSRRAGTRPVASRGTAARPAPTGRRGGVSSLLRRFLR